MACGRKKHRVWFDCMAGETEGSLEDQEEMMTVGGQSQAEETKWQQNQVKKGMEYLRSLYSMWH